MVLGVVLVVALLLTAFGGGAATPVRMVTVPGLAPLQTRPSPEIVALRGQLRLQLPIAQPTAIGYHQAGEGALTLTPVGHQGNAGVLQRVFHKLFGGGGGRPTWYQLSGGSPSALDVGAAAGTDVYSPVDGTVVGISPYVVGGSRFGSRIDIEPQSAPSLVVSLTQLRADPALTVGASVIAGGSKLGTVADLAKVEQQALARYTRDSGNHVSIEIRPAATLVMN